jgi:hypothetical protein
LFSENEKCQPRKQTTQEDLNINMCRMTSRLTTHLKTRKTWSIGSEDGKRLKQDQGRKPKLKASSPMESPIYVVGKFPYGQVNSLLDLRPL